MRLLPLLLALTSCSADMALSNKGALDSGSDGDTGGGDGSNDSADETGFPSLPASYTIEATLVIADGVPSPKGAVLSAIIVGDDDVSVICTVPLDPTGLTVTEAPDADLGAWWSLDVTPDEHPCATLPPTLGLGIGVMAPDVLARLGAVGLDPYASSLFGAYIADASGALYVYGWAGTEADATGDDLAALPLPDGVYGLHPLYLLPLP